MCQSSEELIGSASACAHTHDVCVGVCRCVSWERRAAVPRRPVAPDLNGQLVGRSGCRFEPAAGWPPSGGSTAVVTAAGKTVEAAGKAAEAAGKRWCCGDGVFRAGAAAR